MGDRIDDLGMVPQREEAGDQKSRKHEICIALSIVVRVVVGFVRRFMPQLIGQAENRVFNFLALPVGSFDT
jgi:hypothetical protein